MPLSVLISYRPLVTGVSRRARSARCLASSVPKAGLQPQGRDSTFNAFDSPMHCLMFCSDVLTIDMPETFEPADGRCLHWQQWHASNRSASVALSCA